MYEIELNEMDSESQIFLKDKQLDDVTEVNITVLEIATVANTLTNAGFKEIVLESNPPSKFTTLFDLIKNIKTLYIFMHLCIYFKQERTPNKKPPKQYDDGQALSYILFI
eukprot:GHVU01089135.1.p1 GENE.GHVU01089135.1~~GHVU01089135.1.p1  ORF type:complete len:110 (+),score=19.87 GHVU01089135.1:298-627(+)